MQRVQQLLFPDPRPLVERLGRDFFRQLPARPGIYLMRDSNDVVLYVGKAKNLRTRLGNYRVANPDRMPRRHLRLLRATARIELEECSDESSALVRESELLRSLRPKFNRTGTWPGRPRFFAWRCREQRLYLAVLGAHTADWRLHGPLGGRADRLRVVLARVLWIAVHPDLGLDALPLGWFRTTVESATVVHCGPMLEPAASNLEHFLSGQREAFCDWIRDQLPRDLHPFMNAVVEADLKFLTDMSKV